MGDWLCQQLIVLGKYDVCFAIVVGPSQVTQKNMPLILPFTYVLVFITLSLVKKTINKAP